MKQKDRLESLRNLYLDSLTPVHDYSKRPEAHKIPRATIRSLRHKIELISSILSTFES